MPSKTAAYKPWTHIFVRGLGGSRRAYKRRGFYPRGLAYYRNGNSASKQAITVLIKTLFELTGNKSPEGALIPMCFFLFTNRWPINGGEKLLGGEGGGGVGINDSLRYF